MKVKLQTISNKFMVWLLDILFWLHQSCIRRIHFSISVYKENTQLNVFSLSNRLTKLFHLREIACVIGKSERKRFSACSRNKFNDYDMTLSLDGSKHLNKDILSDWTWPEYDSRFSLDQLTLWHFFPFFYILWMNWIEKILILLLTDYEVNYQQIRIYIHCRYPVLFDTQQIYIYWCTWQNWDEWNYFFSNMKYVYCYFTGECRRQIVCFSSSILLLKTGKHLQNSFENKTFVSFTALETIVIPMLA